VVSAAPTEPAARSPFWRDARIALCGAVAATAMAVGAAASLGQLGTAVASQTLLANGSIHLAAAAAVLCVLLMALGWRIIGGLGVAMAAAVAAVTLSRVDWTPVRPAEDAAARLEVLHFNVLAENRRIDDVAAALRASGADVVVLLESEGIARRFAELADVYPHRFGCDGEICQIAILSKLPLEGAQWIPFPFAEQRLATAVIRPSGRPVRLVAAHFTKDFFASFRNTQGWRVIGQIRRRTRRDPMPVLMTGDFNAAPWDPVVKSVARFSGLRHPRAWLPTWPVALGPLGLQIDHLLVSKDLRVERIATVPDTLGSNHRALRATVALTP
jgi:endonuclease/exonuclease/phosphatase (EEP) superfamily protein YafD